jgi:hypothetical protein
MTERFSLYGEVWNGIDYPALLEQAKETGLLARAEDSGCEGCYVEVARWNDDARQWQRYAFLKCFGGEDGIDGSSRETADRIAAAINAPAGRYASLIHNMPNYAAAAAAVPT